MSVDESRKKLERRLHIPLLRGTRPRCRCRGWRLSVRDTTCSADIVRCLQGAATRENGQAAEEMLLILGEKFVAPIQRRT